MHYTAVQHFFVSRVWTLQVFGVSDVNIITSKCRYCLTTAPIGLLINKYLVYLDLKITSAKYYDKKENLQNERLIFNHSIDTVKCSQQNYCASPCVFEIKRIYICFKVSKSLYMVSMKYFLTFQCMQCIQVGLNDTVIKF